MHSRQRVKKQSYECDTFLLAQQRFSSNLNCAGRRHPLFTQSLSILKTIYYHLHVEKYRKDQRLNNVIVQTYNLFTKLYRRYHKVDVAYERCRKFSVLIHPTLIKISHAIIIKTKSTSGSKQQNSEMQIRSNFTFHTRYRIVFLSYAMKLIIFLQHVWKHISIVTTERR